MAGAQIGHDSVSRARRGLRARNSPSPRRLGSASLTPYLPRGTLPDVPRPRSLEPRMPRHRPHRMYPGALLAQEACSYQGATELLSKLRGRFAVVIHADRDCSNVLPKTGGKVLGDLSYKFLCTNMREDELVTGQGNAKLRRAIELVHAGLQPELIIVLSTCPTVMIGDNVVNVSRKAARDLGIRVEAEVTHGLKPKSPAEIVDVVYSLLARASRPTRDDRQRRINLVGISLQAGEQAELAAGFAALGLTLNTVLNERAGLEDFLGAADAAWLVHPGPGMLVGLRKIAQEAWQQAAVEVPLPIGVAATDAFWRTLAAATGTDPASLLAQPERQAAVTAVAEFRARWAHKPLRVAYNIGSVRSFDLRRIAQEELAELALFDELGFQSAIFIQGPQDETNRQRVAHVLRDLGIERPFCLFPATSSLRQMLPRGAFDLFYGAGFLRDQLSQRGIPLLKHGDVGLGWREVPRALAALDDALSSTFYRTFQDHTTLPDDADAKNALVLPSQVPPLPVL